MKSNRSCVKVLLIFNWFRNVSEENIQEIHQGVQKALNEKHAFEKIIVSKDQAAKLFVDNTFKLDIINSKIPDGALTSAYRCGNLIDLCKGPHIRHTGVVKSFQINKVSSYIFLYSFYSISIV
jgi:threonyl-tRNA synthetase